MLAAEHPECLHSHFQRFTLSASQRYLTADVSNKMKRLLVIVSALLALGCVYVFFLGWENFSLIWIQVPYATSGDSRRLDHNWFRDEFAKIGLFPASPLRMPTPPRTDIATRSGTNSNDRNLVASFSGTFVNHHLCYAWLYDDPSRKEYIVVVIGPGRLSWWQARAFRPTWNQFKQLLGRILHSRIRDTVN